MRRETTAPHGTVHLHAVLALLAANSAKLAHFPGAQSICHLQKNPRTVGVASPRAIITATPSRQHERNAPRGAVHPLRLVALKQPAAGEYVHIPVARAYSDPPEQVSSHSTLADPLRSPPIPSSFPLTKHLSIAKKKKKEKQRHRKRQKKKKKTRQRTMRLLLLTTTHPLPPHIIVRRTMLVRRVLVPDLVEEVDLGFGEEKGGGDGVDGGVTPALWGVSVRV